MNCIDKEMILKATLIVSVTVAAIYFRSATILWWYILTLFIDC